MLQQRDCVLRVRVEQEKSCLAFKGLIKNSTVKTHEEQETVIGEPAVMSLVLKNLGFEAWLNYQKYREEFLHENVVIAVDETPIGTFVELEGIEETIEETAKLLRRNREDYVFESYRTLYFNYQCAQNHAPGHMLFGEAQQTPKTRQLRHKTSGH